MNGVDVGRLPVGFLSGATATVALGTLVEWLVPSVGGWSTGVAVACLTVMAIVVPPLWMKRPGFCSESQQGESEYAQEVQSRAA